MRILGIESSCDETAAAVVKNGRILLSNIVESQIDIHAEYGGVVPEIASRSHLEAIIPVVDKALIQAFDIHSNQTAFSSRDYWSKIDAIAVTNGPGLSGSLLIGTLTGRTLAWLYDKPIIGVNHVLAHAYSNWLLETEPQFPLLALIASGGHSQIALFESHSNYKLLGQTQDDAVGEAFDKVAKMLGFNYPGGPSVAKAAENGNPDAFRFPKAKMTNKYDFSFSGLKTAVLRKLQEIIGESYDYPSFKIAEKLSEKQIADIAASFQKTAIETLIDKLVLANDSYRPKSIIIGGGVAANQLLRQMLDDRLIVKIDYAPINLCTDNAAMIATLASYHSMETNLHELRINPSLSM